VERGSDKHIAYAASKAALDNMTRSFARKLAPEIKVNAIAPSLIMFNEGDDEEYRQQALDKSLMKIAPGEKEISDLIDYLFTSRYVTGRSFAVDGGRPCASGSGSSRGLTARRTAPSIPLRLPAPTAGA
jgi:dihydromonapterin reductase/dihydrofolate reductase